MPSLLRSIPDGQGVSYDDPEPKQRHCDDSELGMNLQELGSRSKARFYHALSQRFLTWGPRTHLWTNQ